jgi:hypothetical protein
MDHDLVAFLCKRMSRSLYTNGSKVTDACMLVMREVCCSCLWNLCTAFRGRLDCGILQKRACFVCTTCPQDERPADLHMAQPDVPVSKTGRAARLIRSGRGMQGDLVRPWVCMYFEEEQFGLKTWVQTLGLYACMQAECGTFHGSACRQRTVE